MVVFTFALPDEMTLAMCQGHPDWLRNTHEIAERMQFRFSVRQTPIPRVRTHLTVRRRASFCGDWCNSRFAPQERYGNRGAEQFHPQVTEELGIISEVGYE